MKNIGLIIYFVLASSQLFAQSDSSKIVRIPVDMNQLLMNMDAIYNRPFLSIGKVPVALGGYIETNSSYLASDGVTTGLEFQIPRFTLFVASSFTKRIKFLSEIEFEGGSKKINIDYAALDFEFHPLINLRGGIIINPIGSFNQNHDGPKYEFISRPLSSTTIIPSVWSNTGFGLHGKYTGKNIAWGYEAYITNGFDNKIISNIQSKTWLSAAKQNPDRYTKSFNGIPLLTFKTAVRHKKYGEFGISWMGGVYNKFEENGLTLDKQRRIDMVAVDFNTTIQKTKTYINAEWVWVFIDVPVTLTQQFGNQQEGGFIDIVQPLLTRKILGWDEAVLSLNFRIDYADYNVGAFTETAGNISDDVIAIIPGISFRPSPQTVIRANYRYHWVADLFGNPPTQVACFQFGFSTYF